MSRKRKNDYHNIKKPQLSDKNIAIHHKEARVEAKQNTKDDSSTTKLVLLLAGALVIVALIALSLHFTARIAEAANKEKELELEYTKVQNEKDLNEKWLTENKRKQESELSTKRELEEHRIQKELESEKHKENLKNEILKATLEHQNAAEIEKYKLVSTREKEMEQQKLSLDKEIELKKFQAEQKTKVELQKLMQEKQYKDKEYNLKERELEVKQQSMLIDANKEMYLKSLEHKKKKKTSYAFGLFSTEEEVDDFPEQYLGLEMANKNYDRNQNHPNHVQANKFNDLNEL